MADNACQSLPLNTSQSAVNQERTSPSAPSSASDEKSTSSTSTRRRKQSSMSTNNATSSRQPRESTRQRQKAQALPTRSRGESSRGATATMPGLLDQEITYTPTTHRISKAKKGKKVHACEFPGCTKIFTRAEHRKRHEANHNTSPAFQCEIEECKKPFQRADLLARHMERQHNMPPAEASAYRTQYRHGSTSEASSPSKVSMSGAHISQQVSAPAPSISQPSGTMSITSIIEPNMHRASFDSHPSGQGLHEISHTPIGTAPRSLLPELLYGLSPSGDSLYSSSDSCYSPLSDYLQPQAVPQQYYPQEVIRRPQSVSLDSCYQPIIQQSPLPAEPTWSEFDPPSLGFSEAPYIPPQRQLVYHSPSWLGAQPIHPYDSTMHPHQPWPWTKVPY